MYTGELHVGQVFVFSILLIIAQYLLIYFVAKAAVKNGILEAKREEREEKETEAAEAKEAEDY